MKGNGGCMTLAVEEEALARELYTRLWEEGTDRSRLLWDILFEADTSNMEIIREAVLEYGSNLKSSDYLGRAVFIRLMALLR